MEAGATTLLIKVKAHRGDPLNEEADIRTELGRLKEYKEVVVIYYHLSNLVWAKLRDYTVSRVNLILIILMFLLREP